MWGDRGLPTHHRLILTGRINYDTGLLLKYLLGCEVLLRNLDIC